MIQGVLYVLYGIAALVSSFKGIFHFDTEERVTSKTSTTQVQLSTGDIVNSYAGLRTIELTKKEDQQIIILNGKPLEFQVEVISV